MSVNEMVAGVESLGCQAGLSILHFPKENQEETRIGYIVLGRYSVVVGPISKLFLCSVPSCDEAILSDLVSHMKLICKTNSI